VERELLAGGACGAANWSETAEKLLAHDRDWGLARGLLLSCDPTVEPVGVDDAELAGLWRAGSGLSLADRLCLAAADRLEATVWTADAAWGSSGRIRQIR
jgi:ribonuclease VapC